MIKVAAKLAVITTLAAAGVHFGYRHLEKKMQASSCLPEPPKSESGRPSADTVRPVPMRPDQPELPADAAQDFQIIVRRDLFKTAVAKAAAQPEKNPATQQQLKVVPTALNLTLAGTVIGTEETARAIILNNAGKDRKQQLLQIGDGVPGTGAVIKTINWNSITLDVNGKLEVLEMPKPKDAPGFGSATVMMQHPTAQDIDMGADSIPEEAEAGHDEPRPNRRINLPPEESAVITEEAPPPDLEIPLPEQPVEEPMPPPELPAIEEMPPPELPHVDVPELPPIDAQ